jgi:hypothetical protein
MTVRTFSCYPPEVTIGPDSDALPRRVRRPRKATLTQALRQAAKAGASVKTAIIENDKIRLEFGEPDHSSETYNPWLAGIQKQ